MFVYTCAYKRHLVSILSTCGNQRSVINSQRTLHLRVSFRTEVAFHRHPVIRAFVCGPAAVASPAHRLTYQSKRSRLSRLFFGVWHLAHPEPRLKGQLLVVAPSRCPPCNHHGRVALGVPQLRSQSALFSVSVCGSFFFLILASSVQTAVDHGKMQSHANQFPPTTHCLAINKPFSPATYTNHLGLIIIILRPHPLVELAAHVVRPWLYGGAMHP